MTLPPLPLPGALPAGTPPVDLWALARRLLWITLAVEAALLVLDACITWHELIESEILDPLCNTAKEDSIPTWFSGMQLAFAALVAGLCARASRVRGLGAGVWWGWVTAVVFFAYLSADELLEIHETIGTALAGGEEAEKELAGYGWQEYVLPWYLAAALVITLLVGPGLWRSRLFGWYVAGGLVYLAGQVLDRVEGLKSFRAEVPVLAERWGVDEYDIEHPMRMAEELCEMLGITFLVQAFLRRLALLSDGTLLRLVARRP